MREIEAVIEQIQAVLAWEHDPDQEYMETLVADYSRNVTAANERLRQCESLLSQGLRTEAIQQCETEPNLLDLTAILDFPEVEFWSDYVSQYELPPLPELMLGVAADLNDAYASEQPVAGLLKLHRLHALALSPLPVRIQVLRELAKKDTSNPLWEEDLARYEDARLTQIETELDTVLNARNTRQAISLERELTTRKWSVAPSRELIKKAQITRARLQTYDARKELRRIADDLAEAYTERNLAIARNLAARWSSLTQVASIPESDSVFESAAPALAWVMQEERRADQETAYQNSIAAMTRALDRNLGIEELERCAAAVNQFDAGMPDELEDRMQDQISLIEGQAKRKKMLIIGAIAAAVLVVAVIVFSFIRSSQHSEEIAHHQMQLQVLIESGKMQEAQQYYTGLVSEAPSIAGSQELMALRNQLDSARMEEERRANHFADLVKAAEDAIATARDPAAINQALNQLKEAESVAVGSAEMARIDAARRSVADVEGDVQKTVDDQFTSDLDDAEKQFLRRPANDMAVNQQLTDLFVSLKRRRNITEELKQPIDEFIGTLDRERAEFQRLMKVNTSLERITAAIGNPGRFQGQLREYVRLHAGSDRSSAMKRVLAAESSLWSGPELWNSFRSEWKTADLKGMPRDAATTLLSRYDSFMNESQQFPAGSALRERVAAIRAIAARRDDDGNPLTDQLQDPLNLYLKLPMVVAVGETRHYTDTDEPPELSGGVVTVVPFRNTRGARASGIRVNETDITNRRSGGRFVWDAPHAVFATDALTELEEAEDHWEETFGGLVTRLAETDGIDPIVKLKLLYDLLKTGSAGSTFFASAFEEAFGSVDGFQGFDANWVTTSGSGAPSARISAQAILRNLPSLDDSRNKAIEMRDAAAKQSAGPAYRWAGWLHRRPDRVWTCATSAGLGEEDSGSLVVLLPGRESDEMPSFAEVGTATGGEITIRNGTAAEGFEEGRPVFLVDEQR